MSLGRKFFFEGLVIKIGGELCFHITLSCLHITTVSDNDLQRALEEAMATTEEGWHILPDKTKLYTKTWKVRSAPRPFLLLEMLN